MTRTTTAMADIEASAVRVPAGAVELNGDLALPAKAKGLVLFAHGSGSSRHSSRNKYVASELNRAGVATLLFDLLTEREEYEERYSRHLRFDIGMLAERLVRATDWAAAAEAAEPRLRDLPVGYFGASTGGGAALVAAAERPQSVAAVVSRGGRPDLAGDALPHVRAPTLLIVGGEDGPVIELNREAMEQLHCPTELKIIPGATHLFEEPGALTEVARLAGGWFGKHFQGRR
jgi:putative phosphoribosyl transferase